MTDTLRRLDLVTAPPVEQLADYLASLIGPARPRRVARMLDPGGDKYKDVPRHVPLDRTKLLAHATGRETWAATLDHDGHSRVGVIEVDQGGRAALVATLAAAERLGLACYAIAVDNPLSNHSGGHVFFTYTENTENTRILAQLQQVASAAGLGNVEIWPRGQVIRLPFGYHRWAKTRGQLLSQAGEIVDLDRDLAGGLDLVTSLQPNAAPMVANVSIDPPVSNGAQSSDKDNYTQSGHVQTRRAPHTIARISPGEQAAGRASLADVKARFNAEHDWAELLGAYGGAETLAGWACNCGWQHTHATQIAITSQDKIVSFSPNCNWAPHKDSGRALDKFGFYVLVEHGNNVVAALKELNPIKSRQRRPEAPEPVTNYRTAAQVADADRKRTARRAAAERLRDTVISRAAIDDDLPWQARLLLDIHLKLANQRGWHRASVARIAEEIGRGDRWVQRFNEYLIDVYVSRTLTSRHDTAIWTLLEKPIQRAATPETDDLGVIEKDDENDGRSPEYISKEILDSDLLELVSGGASPPAENVYPPTLPAWQLAAVERWSMMSDAELNARLGLPCSQGETGLDVHGVHLKNDIALNTEQPEQSAAEPHFAVFADAIKSEPPSAARLLAGLFRRQGRDDDAAEWEARIAPIVAPIELLNSSGGIQCDVAPGVAASEPVAANCNAKKETIQDPSTKTIVQNSALKNVEPSDATDNKHYLNTGATYDPALDCTAGGRLDLSGWHDPREMRLRSAPLDQAALDQLAMPEDEPLIRVAPVEPAALSKYWALRGRARKKTTSPAQRRMLDSLADALMIWVPASEGAAPRPAAGHWGIAPRSQARPPQAGPAFDLQRTLNV